MAHHFHATPFAECAGKISRHLDGQNLHGLVGEPVLLGKLLAAQDGTRTSITRGAARGKNPMITHEEGHCMYVCLNYLVAR